MDYNEKLDLIVSLLSSKMFNVKHATVYRLNNKDSDTFIISFKNKKDSYSYYKIIIKDNSINLKRIDDVINFIGNNKYVNYYKVNIKEMVKKKSKEVFYAK